MRTRLHFLASIGLCLAATTLCAVGARAEGDKTAERNARRQQLQLQNLQQQLQEVQTAKSQADAAKAEADKKLADQGLGLTRLHGALSQAATAHKADVAALADLQARLAALDKQLVEQKRSSDEALAAKERELARALKERDMQMAQLQGRHDDQVKQVADCSDKNQRLIQLSAEILERYRNVSLGEVLHRRDPLFGWSDVQMFNLVQDYRDKAEIERFTPPTNR